MADYQCDSVIDSIRVDRRHAVHTMVYTCTVFYSSLISEALNSIKISVWHTDSIEFNS